ncbi:MAG: TetR family transcriptional regulator [Haloplasmataceae bacterium]|jgi:AcrR family transcriptional regulator|nr:TetR family transcriptional regulator [Haloplasmataceae bacterium]
MKRITKDPQERRKEIMEMANQLFKKNGFELTSINQIVESLSIAKGTFYHYFKSKEEILIAIIDESMEKYIQNIKMFIDNDSYDAVSKLNYVFKMIFFSQKEPDAIIFVEDNKDAIVHQKLDEKFYEKIYPIFLSIITKGIKETTFKITYPEDITQILMIGIRGYIHYHIPHFSDINYAISKIRVIEELFNKLLDVKVNFI